MKVKIGPYPKILSPYEIAEWLCFWAKKVPNEFGKKEAPDWVWSFGNWLAEKKDGRDTALAKLCMWVNSKNKRVVKVKLHKYDTWSMDTTLAYIILPLLKQLKETKHGSPHVDDEDVPPELRSTAPGITFQDGLDENFHKRWDWVLAEMIWAFEQLHADNDWESQYYHGKSDLKLIAEPGQDGNSQLLCLEKGPADTFWCDLEGLKRHQERIRRGTLLFGKYFTSLWD